MSSRTLAYIIVGGLVFFAFRTCESNKDLIAEKTKSEQNLVAANDTAKHYKNKYNESVTEKSIFISTEKELKKQNSDLYKKVKQQEGSIISLSTAIIGLKQDTAMLRSKLNKMTGDVTKIDSTHFKVDWGIEYVWDAKNYDKYQGSTILSVTSKTPLVLKHEKSELTFRESNIDVTFGEKVIDNKYVVYIQSAYPGFTTKSLEGFMMDPNSNKYIKKLIKKQHWFTGWSVGFGVIPGFNIIDGKYGIVVGPSLQLNIYTW